MGKIRKCGLYIRVSTQKQADEEEGSTKNQPIILRRCVEERAARAKDEEWVVVKEYAEKPLSAKDTKRPKFQEMLRDVEEGVINTVLFTELPRLSRSVYDFVKFGEFLKKHDATFVCATNADLDATSLAGATMFLLMSVLAQFERELIVQRTKMGVQERAKRGLRNGGHVYGYDLGEKKGTLTVNSDEAKVVNSIFRWYLELGSVPKVAKRLAQLGIKTKTFVARRGKKHEGRPFSYTSVRQMLENQTYIGLREINKKSKDKVDEYGNPKEPPYSIIPTDYWKGIVDEGIFRKVQGRLADSTKTRAPAATGDGRDKYLLSQLLACGACFEQMTNGGTKKDGGFIRHYVHRKQSRRNDPSRAPVCELPSNLNASRLDDVVWRRIARELDAGAILGAAEAPEPDARAEIETLRAEIADCERVIAENEHSRAELESAYGNRAITGKVRETVERWTADNADLAKDVAEKKERIASLARAKTAKGRQPKPPTSLDDLSVAKRRELLKLVVKGVVLQKNSIILNRFTGEPIVGEVQEREGVRSGRWRFIDVNWLN
jgi:DNA invertase Pin-like site-specific DNA recombinase